MNADPSVVVVEDSEDCNFGNVKSEVTTSSEKIIVVESLTSPS